MHQQKDAPCRRGKTEPNEPRTDGTTGADGNSKEDSTGPGELLREASTEPDELLDDRTHCQVQSQVARLIGQYGFTEDDSLDLEQEVWLQLLKRWETFDPAVCNKRAFVMTVIKAALVNQIRHRQRAMRDYRRTTSLDDLSADHQTCVAELAVSGDSPDLRLDLQTVLKNLPADLRELCLTLQERSLTRITAADLQDLAFHCHCSVAEVKRDLKRLRQCFSQAGLEDYLN